MRAARVLICSLGSALLLLGGWQAKVGSLRAACAMQKESALHHGKQAPAESVQHHDERPADEATLHREDGVQVESAKHHEERQPSTSMQKLTESRIGSEKQHHGEHRWLKSIQNGTEPPRLCTQLAAERFRVKSTAAASDWPKNLTKHDGDFCIAGKSIPQLFVLGVQKAGTTSIAEDMFKVGFSSPHDKRPGTPLKELHSFDDMCGWRSPSRCASACPTMTAGMKLKWAADFKYACGKKGLADGTPLNFRLPGLPQMLKGLYGQSNRELRFLVVLREPLSRMQAGHYQMLYSTRRQAKDYPFQRYVDRLNSSSRVEEYRDKNWDGAELDRSVSVFYMSLYAVQLSKWLGVFPVGQFTVLPKNIYFASVERTRSVLRHIARSIGLEANVNAVAKASHVSWLKHPSLEDDLKLASRDWLTKQFFEPDTERLSRMLSSAAEGGLHIYGFEGQPSPDTVRVYLSSNW